MKNIFLILFLFTSLQIVAQKNDKDRIKALKVAFITERLDLTPKEAQEFWPVYNAYEDNTNQIKHQELREIRSDIRTGYDSMSDEKADELIKKLNKAEIQLHKLRVDFSKDLSKILPSKKIILLKASEEDFRRKMFDEFKKRRGEKR
ncbi:sensor of ECF-type sigma factor [Tamlana sp. I1]|uniref:sensor of ECF-type sigma factor n=1 Tax=Tamlana sp. I1 TaxID=2762061 RepID=UPI0018909700|nr:sensor of ECF-type sigma factor [Tamlana sp. I1]